MSNESEFGQAIWSLWFRLISLAIVGLVFATAIFLAKARIQGWTYYLTTSEVAFEVVVRLVFAALAGVVLGTISTVIALPFLKISATRTVEWTTRIAVVLVLFLDSRFALTLLIEGHGRGPRFLQAAPIAHFLAFVIALAVRRLRNELLGSLDVFLGEKATRRIAVLTVAATFVLAGTEFAFARATHAVRASTATQRPKSNIVLVTFDALTAEEMSLYGYQRPTTPNLEAFAKQATVFTNFYAGSTSTTPCVGVILTGGYPSETHIYGLAGEVPDNYAEKSLPAAMRAAGYGTGAFPTNPWAYYLAKSLKNGFEVLPEPEFHPGGLHRLWDLSEPLHQDSRIGSRIVEYFDIESVWDSFQGIQESPSFLFRPAASFEGAKQVLDALLEGGSFLWVHVLAPHHPYLPDPPEQNRYIPEAELQQWLEEPWEHWKPHYDPAVQSQVDRHRLAYDEYLQSADRAFGNFISGLEQTGRLSNTTVIVSADHGESFEGGIYQHQTADLTRPVIHIPLIVKVPGQTGHTVSFTADQTALAPTILELAGQAKPDWMQGQSLTPWLNRADSGAGQGLAFSEYLERNSVFKPLRRGTVGVLDGEYEYVFYLEGQKGALRPLARAQNWNLDVSAANPTRAAALRATLHSKFPDIVPESK